jgi:hypothetical protein
LRLMVCRNNRCNIMDESKSFFIVLVSQAILLVVNISQIEHSCKYAHN